MFQSVFMYSLTQVFVTFSVWLKYSLNLQVNPDVGTIGIQPEVYPFLSSSFIVFQKYGVFASYALFSCYVSTPSLNEQENTHQLPVFENQETGSEFSNLNETLEMDSFPSSNFQFLFICCSWRQPI